MERFLLRTPFGDFRISVALSGRRPPSGDARSTALRAARELRSGLEVLDPSIIELALALQRAARLDGPGVTADALRGRRNAASSASRNELAQALERALLDGVLVTEPLPVAPLTERREVDLPSLPPLPPPRRESATHSFELKFIDEIGKAISGLQVEFQANGRKTRSTNAAGIALLDDVDVASATAAAFEPEAIAKALDPRWVAPRAGTPPKEANTTEVVFRGREIGPIAVKPAVPNTVVVKPPLGKLLVELFDKTGRARHRERAFNVKGPQSFEGRTDAAGVLSIADVFRGDYTLSLIIESFKGDVDEVVEVAEAPLVVLEPEETVAQLRMIGAVPRSVLARLEMFFNTNKTFLLPTALPHVRKLRQIYLENAPCQVLVVGHADTKGGAAFNDKLSLERAQSVIAYLKDDVEAWFAFYSDADPKKRWGRVEDHLMIISMPGFSTKPKKEDEVRWFQRTRKLQVDGTAGKETRKALIKEYMSLDGASLADFVGEIDATAHGCGENFPLDESGSALDQEPQDEKRDRLDRRVELFFFDREFGITPKPAGANSKPGSTEYPLWRKRVEEVVVLTPADAVGPKVTFVELVDALFRTNSAVVLPEGSAPSDASGEPASASASSVVGTALRFAEANRQKGLLVAGHTDSTATQDFNQKLSEERARCALALLVGGDAERENFKTICDARHKVADYKQILAWVSGAFQGLTFDCNPGAIDDNAATGIEPVKRFQRAYNKNKKALSAEKHPNLVDDGDVGPLTWGAIFDCYEEALRRELGVSVNDLAKLRSNLRFVDDSRKSLGFSEHFPVEELGVDNFRSVTNRRVEFLFFDPDEEPDLAAAEADPETSEVYLPGGFARSSVEVPTTRATVQVFLLDAARQRMPGARYQLSTGLQVRRGKTDDTGRLEERDVLVPRTAFIEWGEPLEEPAVPFQDRPKVRPQQLTKKKEPADAAAFRFQRRLRLDVREAAFTDVDAEAERRLTNMGYTQRTLGEKVAAFQRDYAVKDPKPWFHEPTRQRLFAVHREGIEAEIDPENAFEPPPEGEPEEGSPPAFDPVAEEFRSFSDDEES